MCKYYVSVFWSMYCAFVKVWIGQNKGLYKLGKHIDYYTSPHLFCVFTKAESTYKYNSLTMQTETWDIQEHRVRDCVVIKLSNGLKLLIEKSHVVLTRVHVQEKFLRSLARITDFNKAWEFRMLHIKTCINYKLQLKIKIILLDGHICQHIYYSKFCFWINKICLVEWQMNYFF